FARTIMSTMDRRTFLTYSAAGVASAASTLRLAHAADARETAALVAPVAPPADATWRTFDVVTEVELWPQDLPARLWLPLPLHEDTSWQRPLDYRWSGNAAATGIFRDPKFGAPAFYAEWSDRGPPPRLAVTTRITTRNRSV